MVKSVLFLLKNDNIILQPFMFEFESRRAESDVKAFAYQIKFL